MYRKTVLITTVTVALATAGYGGDGGGFFNNDTQLASAQNTVTNQAALGFHHWYVNGYILSAWESK